MVMDDSRSKSGVQLPPLADDRPARQLRVASDVVEVQVAVDHQADVGELQPLRAQDLLERYASRPVPGLGLVVGLAQAGVEHDEARRMRDRVPVDRLDPRLAGARLGGRPHERAEVQTPHVVDLHDDDRNRGAAAHAGAARGGLCSGSVEDSPAWARSTFHARPSSTAPRLNGQAQSLSRPPSRARLV